MHTVVKNKVPFVPYVMADGSLALFVDKMTGSTEIVLDRTNVMHLLKSINLYLAYAGFAQEYVQGSMLLSELVAKVDTILANQKAAESQL